VSLATRVEHPIQSLSPPSSSSFTGLFPYLHISLLLKKLNKLLGAFASCSAMGFLPNLTIILCSRCALMFLFLVLFLRHMFVLAGSALHWICIYVYLLDPATISVAAAAATAAATAATTAGGGGGSDVQSVNVCAAQCSR